MIEVKVNNSNDPQNIESTNLWPTSKNQGAILVKLKTTNSSMV